MKEYVVGIDIGGTKLATVVADKTGHILGKVRKPTLSEKGPEYAIGLLFDMVREVVRQVGLEQKAISAIGVSCGGPLDTKTGIVYSPSEFTRMGRAPPQGKAGIRIPSAGDHRKRRECQCTRRVQVRPVDAATMPSSI